MNPIAMQRAQRALMRQDYEKTMVREHGSASMDYSNAGPPHWDRQAWEGFKSQYGYYPFGMQDGGMVYPASFTGAPDWVYELMGIRKPPVTVGF